MKPDGPEDARVLVVSIPSSGIVLFLLARCQRSAPKRLTRVSIPSSGIGLFLHVHGPNGWVNGEAVSIPSSGIVLFLPEAAKAEREALLYHKVGVSIPSSGIVLFLLTLILVFGVFGDQSQVSIPSSGIVLFLPADQPDSCWSLEIPAGFPSRLAGLFCFYRAFKADS